MNLYLMTLELEKPHAPRELAAALRRLGVDLPAEILNGPPATYGSDAAQLIAETVDQRDHLEDAAQAVIRGEDPTEHLILAAAWQFHPGLVQRIQDSGKRGYIEKANEHADQIIEAIREQVFEPTLDKLRALDKKHPGAVWRLDTAVSLNDYRQAAVIKDNADIARALTDCIKVRELLHPEAFDTDAAWSDEPGLIDTLGQPKPNDLSWWMYALQNAYTLDYPTLTEWLARDESDEFTQHRDARKPAEVPVSSLGYDSPLATQHAATPSDNNGTVTLRGFNS